MSVFTAGQIATALEGAVTVSIDEDPKRAAARLGAHRFDQAPVVQGVDTVMGWASSYYLARAQMVTDVLTPLSATPIVAASASVAEVLSLVKTGLVFCVKDHGLNGFITPSDLDKNAVRGHFFVLIAGIERRLADLVDERVEPEKILRAVNARGDSKGRLKRATHSKAELRLVEYLYLSDLITLFRTQVAVPPPSCDAALDDLVGLRNDVMHPVKPMVEYASDRDLAALDQSIGRLARWLESLEAAADQGIASSAGTAR